MDTESNSELAIIAVTTPGAALGRSLRTQLPGSSLYVLSRHAAGGSEHAFSSLSAKFAAGLVGNHRRLVLIMATGIAVRILAPHIKDKRSDPAVVVMDDRGRYAISLLSGHTGGANELALLIGALTGAQPVVTTSSDARGLLSLDMLAKREGWKIPDTGNLAQVSSALVNGEKVGFYRDAGHTDWKPQQLSPGALLFKSIGCLAKSNCAAAVIISDRIVDTKSLHVPNVVCRPADLVVGIGCNRGTGAEEIEDALLHLLEKHGLSVDSLACMTTVDVKRGEPGIAGFARKYSLPVDYCTASELSAAKFPSAPSRAALKHVGVPSVCEAAAVARGGNIIVRKTAFSRKITLAIARRSGNPPGKAGRLYIIGIGPGSAGHMTLRARQAIAESDCVIGYSTYIGLLSPLLAGKEVISSSMGREVERVNKSIELTASGRTVSLISSGDPGIYGMAGLALELIALSKADIEVETIPGVTAAAAAAALLGAPLNVDVAHISLSDHLLPWENIVHRLDCAAKSGFIIALYNPKSRARRQHLSEAVKILRGSLGPSTPAGIVSNAYRDGQAIVITDLGSLPGEHVDMDSIVIVGNSATTVSGGRMITPRGYASKYDLEWKGKGR